MKRLNRTQSLIFILLCVLCFQKQPFRFLFVSCIELCIANPIVILIKAKGIYIFFFFFFVIFASKHIVITLGRSGLVQINKIVLNDHLI